MTLLEKAQWIANNNKLPGRVVDWASDVFDRLCDHREYLKTWEVQTLERFTTEDTDYGNIEYWLTREGR